MKVNIADLLEIKEDDNRFYSGEGFEYDWVYPFWCPVCTKKHTTILQAQICEIGHFSFINNAR